MPYAVYFIYFTNFLLKMFTFCYFESFIQQFLRYFLQQLLLALGLTQKNTPQ
jgi:hypothetical protein